MVRRRECRLRTVLPVRIFGMDSAGKPFTALAHTLDVTRSGARLAGVQHALTVGEIIGIQRGTDKARFRVVWIGNTNTSSTGQVGVECVQENKNIWSIAFEDGAPDTFDVTAVESPPAVEKLPRVETNPPERRRFARHACDIGLEIQLEGSPVSIFARCTDISRGGCYIETRSPFQTGNRLFLCLKTERFRVRALAEVRSSHPSMGMGVRFTELGEDDRKFLADIINELVEKDLPQPGAGLLGQLREGGQVLSALRNELGRYDLHQVTRRILETSLSAAQNIVERYSEFTGDELTSKSTNQALLAEQARIAIQMLDQVRRDLHELAFSPEQVRALRASLQSTLEQLPATPTPPYDMPFIVSSSRSV